MIMRFLFVFSSLMFISDAHARVRTVEADGNKMIPITLSLGRSTVLQFLDTPKQVINGNSNYTNVEFSGNDVTIQPLGRVNSNLFVYSGYRKYGFVFEVCLCNNYDDLVKVYWKQPKKNIPKITEKKEFKGKSFRVGKTNIYVNDVFYHKFNDVYVVSGSLVLPKGSKKPLKSQLWITSQGRKEQVLDVIYQKTSAFSKLNNYKFRLFLKLNRPKSFALRAKFNLRKGYLVINKGDY